MKFRWEGNYMQTLLVRLAKIASEHPETRKHLIPIIKETGSKFAYSADPDSVASTKKMWPKVLKWLRAGDTASIENTFEASKQEALTFLEYPILPLFYRHVDHLKSDQPYLNESSDWRAELDANLKAYSREIGFMVAAWAGMFPEEALKTTWHKERFSGLEEWWSESGAKEWSDKSGRHS
jgi:hypothetical protein